MKCCAWLFVLGLAACSTRAPGTSASYMPNQPACRATLEGARLVADRGIGGTGAPVHQPSLPAQRSADRGIGGSGAPALQTAPDLRLQMETADRGIGGTGIIGVVTGFGSICLAGQRVELPDGVQVRIDDRASDMDALRTGHVVAVNARKSGGALTARTIDVLHLVVGPVESVSPGAMTVAGQQVRLKGANGPALDAKPGAWVAISGLRQPEGTIEATRADLASPDLVMVRGELVRIYGATRIGSLAVRLPAGSSLPGGWSVVVTGRLEGSVLIADTAAIDPNENPSEFFGPATTNFIVEGYVTAARGGYFVNHLFVPAAGLDVTAPTRRRVLAFERTPDGKLSAAEDLLGDHGGLNRDASQNRNDPFAGPLPGSMLTPRTLPPPPEDRPTRGRR